MALGAYIPAPPPARTGVMCATSGCGTAPPTPPSAATGDVAAPSTAGSSTASVSNRSLNPSASRLVTGVPVSWPDGRAPEPSSRSSTIEASLEPFAEVLAATEASEISSFSSCGWLKTQGPARDSVRTPKVSDSAQHRHTAPHTQCDRREPPAASTRPKRVAGREVETHQLFVVESGSRNEAPCPVKSSMIWLVWLLCWFGQSRRMDMFSHPL